MRAHHRAARPLKDAPCRRAAACGHLWPAPSPAALGRQAGTKEQAPWSHEGTSVRRSHPRPSPAIGYSSQDMPRAAGALTWASPLRSYATMAEVWIAPRAPMRGGTSIGARLEWRAPGNAAAKSARPSRLRPPPIRICRSYLPLRRVNRARPALTAGYRRPLAPIEVKPSATCPYGEEAGALGVMRPPRCPAPPVVAQIPSSFSGGSGQQAPSGSSRLLAGSTSTGKFSHKRANEKTP